MSQSSSSQIRETEEQLVAQARDAVSQCNWVVGECAMKWTKKYARGRTDADFAAQVGLSTDQVYQRRRVWERFGESYLEYPSLKWSHFYVALNWDDGPDCLQWAQENEATVAEMRAWRRVQRGEEGTTEPSPDPWVGDPAVSFLPHQPTAVRDPWDGDSSKGGSSGSRFSGAGSEGEPAETVSGVAREAEAGNGDYAPFRKGAMRPASEEPAVAEKPQPSAEQVIRRMTGSLRRMNQKLTAELAQEMHHVPEKVRDDFARAINELNAKVAELL